MKKLHAELWECENRETETRNCEIRGWKSRCYLVTNSRKPRSVTTKPESETGKCSFNHPESADRTKTMCDHHPDWNHMASFGSTNVSLGASTFVHFSYKNPKQKFSFSSLLHLSGVSLFLSFSLSLCSTNLKACLHFAYSHKSSPFRCHWHKTTWSHYLRLIFGGHWVSSTLKPRVKQNWAKGPGILKSLYHNAQNLSST